MRSNASQADMSDRITWSPGFSPDTTSTLLTDVRPSFTWTRVGLAVGLELEQADGCSAPARRRAGRPDDVGEPFELDGAVHAHVGPRAFRQRPVQ